MQHAQEKIAALTDSLAGIIQGNRECIEVLVISLLSNGSVLMQDVPGVGKTTLAKAVAKAIDVQFHRVQFTPDLLPADILGSSIYNPNEGTFSFRPGPVFCHVLLADEINRASPRTQSALLEAMSEMHATIEGVQHDLPSPFLVLATQNPVEFHGTYPLPEAQLDRFLVQLELGYPDADTEVKILHAQAITHPLESLQSVLSKEDVVAFQSMVRNVRVDESISRYIVDIIQQTRVDPRLKLGVSPRGSLMLFRASQAAAFAAGRDYVLPDDVQRLAPYVLSHRLIMTPKAKYSGASASEMVAEILARVKVPS
ncbi:AAA family ATPase [Aporhodopirellula aestuarii]|uniref:MoxR family ATPase n=1 Tax=Aporhodopirellula aestuarii TaxID=2950107 RepID=A0ABT0TY49_9BACT|nr:MoxR family ATPase [Aporhodopirellula aestuarii]MCM2369401.1 MoxR family ATPase [Aporhodopirellula aestuarii]